MQMNRHYTWREEKAQGAQLKDKDEKLTCTQIKKKYYGPQGNKKRQGDNEGRKGSINYRNQERRCVDVDSPSWKNTDC